ncbi:hypothetical protein ACFPIJ_54285 [Dactylosporangium cerinum]|uniref:Uncharacterized protein n=1 Tax=Dactylosporangium cerinum TaxID=1434730 RepID=A0ABV9WEJ8_9ACTN
MTSPAFFPQCSTLRRIEDASWRLWLSMYVLVYVALDLGTLSILAAAEGDRASRIIGVVILGVVWTMPLHIAAVVLAAGELMLLRAVAADLQRFWFRLSALGVFVLPALALTLLGTAGDTRALLAVMPMHIVMGLLVVQPRFHWANSAPGMDQHAGSSPDRE